MAEDSSTDTPLIPHKLSTSNSVHWVFCVSGGDVEAVCVLSRCGRVGGLKECDVV